jgi:predicted nucleotidyltransferase
MQSATAIDFSKNELAKYRFWQALFALPYVKRVILFGSRAQGTHRPTSDIDLMVEMDAPDIRHWDRILEIIEESDTLLLTDCVNYFDALKQPALLRNILKDGVVIYER